MDLNDFKTTVSTSVQNAIDKTWNNQVVDNINGTISSNINNWLGQHPMWAWLYHHAFISLILSIIAIILIIRLVLTIYRAIASTIDRIWLWILQSPFKLAKFLFGWEAKPKNIVPPATITNYEITNNPEQLSEILQRLSDIQQQQQQILQDIALLKQQQVIIESKPIMLSSQELNLQLKKVSENVDSI
ncbi:hypothetical protein NIES4102_31870 [Chondrocystis sp. NIES-4102]|nr:hypothetical protein NIES4102_31870 [Chondrocystis sp. NIES-4102]